MVTTTRAQREALKRVFDRAPIYDTKTFVRHPAPNVEVTTIRKVQLTYRQFRKSVQPTFLCDGAVVVPWAGMWLAVETDGYTHS